MPRISADGATRTGNCENGEEASAQLGTDDGETCENETEPKELYKVRGSFFCRTTDHTHGVKLCNVTTDKADDVTDGRDIAKASADKRGKGVKPSSACKCAGGSILVEEDIGEFLG
jgi:hypothetical protein